MPKLPRSTKKARLLKIIAESQAEPELINQKEAEEQRRLEQRFIGLLGRAVNRELKDGDLLSEEIVYALLDKHTVRGVDRKFLSEAFEVPLTENTPSAKNTIVRTKKAKKAKAVAKSKAVKTRPDASVSDSPALTNNTLKPLPMPNSQQDLSQDFFFDEDYSVPETGAGKGL